MEQTIAEANRLLPSNPTLIAKHLGITPTKVKNILSFQKKHGFAREKKYTNPKGCKKMSLEKLKKLKEWIGQNQKEHKTVDQIKTKALSLGVNNNKLSKKGVQKILHKNLKLSYKKTALKKETLLQDQLIRERKCICFLLCHLYAKGSEIISIDESGFHMTDARPYGWGEKSKRLEIYGTINKTNYTLGLAISKSGPIAAQIMESGYTQFTFLSFMKNLVMIMKKNKTFDAKKVYFLMDNLTSHKTKLVKEFFIKNEIKVIFNASHSPDFNPIEMVFNTLKTMVKTKLHDEKFVF